MSRFDPQRELADFRRLSRVKEITRAAPKPLGPEMLTFFQQSVQKRQGKLTQIGEYFAKLVPEALCDHCSIESLSRGTLTVLVDSASHLYELKQLLLAGLQDQLFIVCKSTGLKKINLKPGRWYDDKGDSGRMVRFQ